MPTSTSDKELVDLFKKLQQADEQYEAKSVELRRLEERVSQLKTELEDNVAVIEAQKALWTNMVERNLQMLWFDNSVAVLIGSRVRIYNGLRALNLEE